MNHPYEAVRAAVQKDAAAILQKATQVAERRSGEIVAALSVNIVQLSKDILIKVGAIREKGAGFSRATHVELEWHASERPSLFPSMKGDLRVYPLSPTETRVDFDGEYELPLGVLRGALDAVVGHRWAEASVHGFVRAVVERLRRDVVG